MIVQVLKSFCEKQEMVVLNAFDTDFTLQQSEAIVNYRKYRDVPTKL